MFASLYPSDMAVYHAGEHGRPVMVLLHGVTDSAAALADAMAHFSRHFDVLACDFRGHGLSARFTPEMLANPISVMVDEVTTLLRALRESGCEIIVCAHSMGGAVASEVLCRDPFLADALILEEPAWLDDDERQRYRQDGAPMAKRIAHMRAQPIEAMHDIASAYPAWSWTEISAWYQAKCLVDLDFVTTGQVCPATPYMDYITSLNVPTLLLSGGIKTLLPQKKCDDIRAVNNPHIHHVTLPKGGHCLRRDLPAAFYAQVDAWLVEHIRV